MDHPRLNEAASMLVEAMVARAEALSIKAHDDGVNVPVIDCGIEVSGGVEAGCRLAEICMAGMGQVRVVAGDPGLWPGPAVSVQTDSPLLGCMAAQYAGWQVSHEDFFAMGSGPMRALAGKEELFKSLGVQDASSVAVGTLETRRLPPPIIGKQLAEACGVDPRRLTLLVAPTGSLAGTIQVVARSVETALHKMHELGFDLKTVRSGWGVAPLPPIAADDLVGIGVTNDAILYGGQVQLWVDTDDESLERLVPQIPSSASKDYGKPFAEVFAEYNHNFYDIDPHLFSPAWVRVNNLRTGSTFTAGQVDSKIIKASFETKKPE